MSTKFSRLRLVMITLGLDETEYYGPTVYPKLNSVRLTNAIRQRAVLEADVVSLDGSYRPAIDQELYLEQVTEAGASGRVWAGVIQSAEESGLVTTDLSDEIVTRISVADYSSYTDRRYATIVPTTGTVKSFLSYLVTNYLSAYHITLDAGMADGPTLTDYSFTDRKIRDILDELMLIAGWAWTVDMFKVLRANAPGSIIAPYILIPLTCQGDVRVKPNRQFYANRVILQYGTGAAPVTERHPGNSSTHDFVLNHPFINLLSTAATIWDAPSGGSEQPGGGYIYLNSPSAWWFETATNTLHSSGVVATGNYVEISYTGQFPDTVTAQNSGEIAAHGIWETIITAPDVFDAAVAAALAQAYLDQSLVTSRHLSTSRLRIPSLLVQYMFAPGQELTVILPSRHLNTIFVISDVQAYEEEGQLLYDIEADEGDTVAGSWRDTYKEWSGGGGGGTSASSGGFSPSSVGRWAYPLGGSGIAAQQSGTPTWVDTPSFIDVQLNSVAIGASTVTAVVMLRAMSGGVSVTARIQDVTNNVTAGTSSVVTSTSWAVVLIPVTVSVGEAFYRLQLLPSVANEDVFGTGYVEIGR